MSDGTQLTTYTGDKKAWPIYLTIGNISQAFRGKPSNHATVLLAFLLIPPKVGKVGATIKRQIQKNTHRIIQIILGHILLSIQVEENNPLIALCGDGKARSCHLISATGHEFPKPDILHTIWLGMIKHLIEWLVSFLEKHSRMSVFNQIWLSVSSFYDMTAPNKTYSDVTQ